MLTRGVEVPGMAFWHDPGSSRRNSQVDPWCWNPENTVLACCRVVKELSSNEEAAPSVKITPVRPDLKVGAPKKAAL
eukprot:395567-Pyramimonas_sp.AAC.1